MDQYPAQPTDNQENSALEGGVPPSSSPLKKLLPFLIIGAFLLTITAGILILFSGKSTQKAANTLPTTRPTATPMQMLEPTIPLVTIPISTPSATVSPVAIGRLAFIKDGDIFHSDLTTFSLLVKNATPAGDKLSWSAKGNLLAWRPKTVSATPSALTIYNRDINAPFTFSPSKKAFSEVIDYAWSSDDKQIAVLFHDDSYNISLFSIATSSASPSANLINRNSPIKQIIWPKTNTLIFAGEEGISSVEVASSSSKLLVSNKNVMNLKLSPKKDKILFSVGDAKKNDLYLMNVDGTNSQLINPKPPKIEMSKSNLPETILDKGFILQAIFMPEGDKLLVGYHYQELFPLVGIYDLKQNSFTAIAPFSLRNGDLAIDNFRLLGERVNTTATPSWQLSLFTIEDESKFGIIRVIPGASSPSFYGEINGL